ncbi:MAG: flagellar biosynthesis protein FlhB [Alkaliphilus sp.]
MKIIINLQLFNQEKTEKHTHKKLRESREKGQVLQSKEVNSAILLLASFITLNLLSRHLGSTLLSGTNFIYTEYLNTEFVFTIANINRLTKIAAYHLLMVFIPLAGMTLVIGLAVSYMQVGFLFTTKTLEIKLSRLNPIEGLKRMFSLKSLVELVKSFVKIILVGYIVYAYMRNQMVNITNTVAMSVESIISVLNNFAISIGVRASAVLIMLAILDYIYQRYEYYKGLKMSKQEVKEEYKQTEGNPQLKSKIKEKQRQMSMMRMMQDVPKADVIITNPTHIAIAIQYDPSNAVAPKLLAKGQEFVASKIKNIAKENDIPIIENKKLARTMFEIVEIGDFIPPDLYQPVAEILAYIYQINKRD